MGGQSMGIRNVNPVICGAVLGFAFLVHANWIFAQDSGKKEGDSAKQSEPAPAPTSTPVSKIELAAEFKRLSGSWRPDSAILAGDKIPDEVCAKIQLDLQDDKFQTLTNGIETSGKISLDLSTDPHSMDIKIEEGPEAGKTIKCIYKIADDHLHVAYSLTFDEVRPTDFESNQDNKLLLIVYRRIDQSESQESSNDAAPELEKIK